MFDWIYSQNKLDNPLLRKPLLRSDAHQMAEKQVRNKLDEKGRRLVKEEAHLQYNFHVIVVSHV